MRDRAIVVDSGLGLDSCPLDRQAMVGQPEAGKEREVFGVTRAEAVAGTGTGAWPSRSHCHQSDAGAAPSHCVDDAPVPHMNPSGHRTPGSMQRGQHVPRDVSQEPA